MSSILAVAALLVTLIGIAASGLVTLIVHRRDYNQRIAIEAEKVKAERIHQAVELAQGIVTDTLAKRLLNAALAKALAPPSIDSVLEEFNPRSIASHQVRVASVEDSPNPDSAFRELQAAIEKQPAIKVAFLESDSSSTFSSAQMRIVPYRNASEAAAAGESADVMGTVIHSDGRIGCGGKCMPGQNCCSLEVVIARNIGRTVVPQKGGSQ